ncbi:MAG: dihydroorotate dehydrogenase [Candidatus Cloacimonadota bacterium]|nr:MAG: dihydroorotate dehydrogenase [bacterium]PCJ21339.1 MAG: dihydroorotate dehydrogenase [Candidatus Cloacimonadota bacterium]
MRKNTLEKIVLVVCIMVPIFVLCLPTSMIPIAGITLIQHRLLAIFILAVLFWIFEPIEIHATSVLIIFLELIFLSDKGPVILVNKIKDSSSLIDYKEILFCFSSPIIMLFLGGFFLALAASKYGIDRKMAQILLKPFGVKTNIVLFGMIMITAIFSMFMSNTATTAMMLAILIPVVLGLDSDDPSRKSFALAIPFAANIGGLGTPIGTPPNAVALKYLIGDNSVSFLEWMSFAVPYVLFFLIILWFLLLFFFPPKCSEIHIKFDDNFVWTKDRLLVALIFFITIFLWLSSGWHGVNSYIVALFPVTVFSMTRLVNISDMHKLAWDVLWLVSGGIALGFALEKTGLSRTFINSIDLSVYHPVVLVAYLCTLSLIMATFMSNTATSNLTLPIAAAFSSEIVGLDAFGGQKMLIIAVAFSCSLAMSLPVSTPPNAMSHASGLINVREMSKLGVLVGALGLIGLACLVSILLMLDFF